MKKLLIIITILIFAISVNAQTIQQNKVSVAYNQKLNEMKSGKYLKSDAKNLYIGTWVSNEPAKEIEILITSKMTKMEGGDMNYYTDAIYLNIKKCIYKGVDVSKQNILPIVLTGDSSKYRSFSLKDPISEDEIIIKIYSKDKSSLLLNVNTTYSPGTSTIFPLGNTILKRKEESKN